MIVLALIPAGWLGTGFYTVEQGETAVKITLGRITYDPAVPLEHQLISPGGGWHWPWPVGQVYRMPRESTRTLVLNQFLIAGDKAEKAKQDFRDMFKASKRQPPPAEVVDALFEPTLGTGDRNVVQAELIVRYRAAPPVRPERDPAARPAASPGMAALRESDPDLADVLETNPRAAGDFLRTRGWNWTFLLPEREAMRHEVLDSVFYSALVECVARLPVQDVLTAGRSRIAKYVHERAQARFDALDLGVQIIAIELKEVRVPKLVRDDFARVVQAEQQAKTEILNAETRRAELLTEAQAIADERRKLAASDADRLVKQARAEADAFRKLSGEQRVNPELTTDRLWNNMMRKVSAGVRLQVLPDDADRVIIQVRSRRE